MKNRMAILILAVLLSLDLGALFTGAGRRLAGSFLLNCYYYDPTVYNYQDYDTHPERGCGLGETWEQLLANGDFESGDLSRWTVAAPDGAASEGTIEVISGENAPLAGTTLTGPARGRYYAVSDQAGPSTRVLMQSFTVPREDNSFWLTFYMFVLDTSGAGPIDAGVLDHTGPPNQHVRVDILENGAGDFDTGAGVVDNLYLGVDGSGPEMPYRSYSFDLDGVLAPGRTYLLRFAVTATEGPIHMGVDNVNIRSRNE